MITHEHQSSGMVESHAKMRDEILKAIREFEEQTRFMVCDIEINRGGCTSGDVIYGIYLPITPKDR
jgi:hypothetical protein